VLVPASPYVALEHRGKISWIIVGVRRIPSESLHVVYCHDDRLMFPPIV
jgi:hypothetical protein